MKDKTINTEKLKRRLNRLIVQKKLLESKHNGNETKYTYHGGFDMGYLKGKISEIENTLDELCDKFIC
tara:strand:+ start:6241 stop:6444 length:204 start_codon:yes stop_codon:yes gene_type:complete